MIDGGGLVFHSILDILCRVNNVVIFVFSFIVSVTLFWVGLLTEISLVEVCTVPVDEVGIHQIAFVLDLDRTLIECLHVIAHDVGVLILKLIILITLSVRISFSVSFIALIILILTTLLMLLESVIIFFITTRFTFLTFR